MIVTLGTIQPPTHEDSKLFSHQPLYRWRLIVALHVNPCGAVVTLRRNAFSNHPVVRHVLSDALSHPFPVKMDPSIAPSYPKQIGKTKGPVIHVLGGIQQDVDE